jgi:hypothetical protein
MELNTALNEVMMYMSAHQDIIVIGFGLAVAAVAVQALKTLIQVASIVLLVVGIFYIAQHPEMIAVLFQKGLDVSDNLWNYFQTHPIQIQRGIV